MNEIEANLRKHKTAIGFLLLAIFALGGTVGFLLYDRSQIITESDEKIKQLYVSLANSDIGFTDSSEFVLPIDDEFEDEVEGFIARKESFIAVDLAQMRVSLYKDGELTKELPVLSKGRDGSWWETPTGNYKILTKEENHFSSIGKVWMPWSMQFYGNFFIHGWPYYDDGTPVSSAYSGGCVRLSTEDANVVYEFAEKGMPLLLRDQEDTTKFAKPSITKSLSRPKLSAQSYLVFDLATGDTILEKNSRTPLPVASLTKIMTGIVASELVYLGKPIAVNESMLAATFAHFQPMAGEKYVAFDLLYPLLMQSSDEAANILAGYIGENMFVNNMNKKAVSLSMKATEYSDPSGESDANISTAADIEKLLRYTYFKRHFIFDITRGKQDYRFEGRKLDNLENFNNLLEPEHLVGIKSGKTETEAESLAGVWEFETPEGKVPVGIVILGSENSTEDAESLLTWLKESFEL